MSRRFSSLSVRISSCALPPSFVCQISFITYYLLAFSSHLTKLSNDSKKTKHADPGCHQSAAAPLHCVTPSMITSVAVSLLKHARVLGSDLPKRIISRGCRLLSRSRITASAPSREMQKNKTHEHLIVKLCTHSGAYPEHFHYNDDNPFSPFPVRRILSE